MPCFGKTSVDILRSREAELCNCIFLIRVDTVARWHFFICVTGTAELFKR